MTRSRECDKLDVALVSRPANDFTNAFDLFEDGLAGGGPDERVCLGVVGSDEGLDLGDEVLGADAG